jgi:hypothetical protein
MRLSICVPARDTVHAGFALSLAKIAKTIDCEILMNLGTVIPEQRNQLISESLEKGCTHILWLDSDMHLPANTANILLSHNKEIVAASYSTRMPPYQSVAFTNPDNLSKRLNEKEGLHKVWAVGMGCMLVNTKVYEYLEKPWHQYIEHKESKTLMGEDIYFCKNANDAGFDIFIDADLSKKIAHYGTKSFKL